MRYLLRKNEDGLFVAQPGSRSSYTPYLQRAQFFSSREEAQRQACGNETVTTLDDIIEQRRLGG